MSKRKQRKKALRRRLKVHSKSLLVVNATLALPAGAPTLLLPASIEPTSPILLIEAVSCLPHQKPLGPRFSRWSLAGSQIALWLILTAGTANSISWLSQMPPEPQHSTHSEVRQKYTSLQQEVSRLAFELPDRQIEQKLNLIQVNIEAGDNFQATEGLKSLRHSLDESQANIDLRPIVKEELSVPILLYHKTPVDFEHQLSLLEQRGYQTIDLDQLSAAFRGRYTLPPKPIVITFDDGFADQVQAADILRSRNMKATFIS